MSVFGLALQAYADGDTGAVLGLERDDGAVTQVPVEVFFRQPSDWFPIEREALRCCRGWILDVGAGTGVHSKWLQQQGFKVTAIDVAREAVAIMRGSGMADARQVDVWDLSSERFDTILILGRSIGLVGDLEGLRRLLVHFRSLLEPGGQVLLNSLDVSRTDDEGLRRYAAANAARGRYPGEVRFREQLDAHVGPVVRWLHVDPASLEEVATGCGWGVRILHSEGDGNYLAQITWLPFDGDQQRKLARSR